MIQHKLETLPKWAQQLITELENDLRAKDIERKRIESMLPWTEPGMEWYTIGAYEHDQYSLFELTKDRAQVICTLGPKDRLFIGRSR